MKHGVVRFPTAARGPRRIRLPEGILVLPPVSLRDLPPDGQIGLFMGVASLRFTTPSGLVAVFLHDLSNDAIDGILAGQRREAEAQLGADYERRALWWERKHP